MSPERGKCMLLVVDIGNTNTSLGVYKRDCLKGHWRVSTDRRKTSDEYDTLLRQIFFFHDISPDAIGACAISSVVPPLSPVWAEAIRKCAATEPLLIGPGIRTGMDLKYDSPRDVGADRIAGAVAAYQKFGGPCIIVDFGTATTYDAISKEGEYLGGAIAPGVVISTEALFQHAARLPRVEVAAPKTAIGRNTVAAMQSGIVFGYAGQVEFMVDRIKQELGGSAKVIATGGLAKLIAQETKVIDEVDSLLVLEGIRLVWEMNRI